MADAAIIIRWNRVVPGREQAALSLFGQSLEYYGSLQSEGGKPSYSLNERSLRPFSFALLILHEPFFGRGEFCCHGYLMRE